MAWLSIRQFIIAALGLFIFLLLKAGVAGILRDENSVNIQQIKYAVTGVPESIAKVDFGDLSSSFEQFKPPSQTAQLSAEELAKKRAEEEAIKAAQIDKTLRPNFEALDDEHQIGVVGIFQEKKNFAIVQIINFADKSVRYEKLYEKDKLEGYELIFLDKNSIKLRSERRELSLALFKGLKG
jgi:hypothetical protein